ncbi:ribosomal protein S18-alanine N-acetyltransferase [Demequina aestuarii]|uniref:ribosomal protein S18-alanine N-acetyltransferase n=1 Tax=Demequina aestuarii TaxID=327095 RepID=UPI00078298E7|nr:ribosomal protein S18-alanine N-acetyltransferase [Demequina aestuarii]
MRDASGVDPASASAVSIRDLDERDLDRVAELESEIFGASAWSRALIREDFLHGPSRWRGVEGEESLSAYAVYGFDGDAFHLMNLAVAPEARRQGLGEALMADFMAEARRLHVRDAWLEVAVTNEAALALYRAYGFADVRVRRRYYQPEGIDALVMRARLPHPS